MLSEELKTHDRYSRLLNKIGDALGYDTKIPRDERYHLANPDSVWFVDPKILGLSKVPVVAFEVVYSEREKAIRGSIKSFEITGSPIGVLVLVKEGFEKMRRKNQTPEQSVARFKDYAKRLIEAQGLKRYYVWDESDVDRLAQKLGLTSRFAH